MTLGLAGAGLLSAPAAHADDLETRVDQAQSAVERLDARAQQRGTAHERAQDRVGASQARVERLTQQIREQRTLADSLRSQVARGVLVEHAEGGGTVVPVAAEPLPDASEDLLAGVAVVTEDTEGKTARIAEASASVQELRTTRAGVREVLQERRAQAERLGTRAAKAASALEAQQGRLAELEAEQAAAQEKARAEAAASSAVDFAMAQVGKAYVYGAAGPDAFDCSGLTMAAWATEGVSLPHNSGAQYSSGTPVSESELQPGDLVFYYSPISHVGIYVGDGQIVNALNPGSGVQISGLHDMPFSGAVRPG